MEKTSFLVPSISCKACSDKIVNELKALSGVRNVSVDIQTKEVSVSFDSSMLSPETLKQKVEELGFEVERPIN